jgi:hypothetical protein
MARLGRDCVGGYYVDTFNTGYWASSVSYPDATTVEVTGEWTDTGSVAYTDWNQHCFTH